MSVLQKYKSKRAGGNPNIKNAKNARKPKEEPSHANHFTSDNEDSDSDSDYEEVLINIEPEKLKEPETPKKPEKVKKSLSTPVIIKKTIKKYYNKKTPLLEEAKIKDPVPEIKKPPSYLSFNNFNNDFLKNKIKNL